MRKDLSILTPYPPGGAQAARAEMPRTSHLYGNFLLPLLMHLYLCPVTSSCVRANKTNVTADRLDVARHRAWRTERKKL